MRQGINSSTIAIGAAVLMFVSAPSAHPHAPAMASRANGSLAYSPRALSLGASWLSPAKLGPPAGFDGGGHSAEALSPLACLDGNFHGSPWGCLMGSTLSNTSFSTHRPANTECMPIATPQRSQDRQPRLRPWRGPRHRRGADDRRSAAAIIQDNMKIREWRTNLNRGAMAVRISAMWINSIGGYEMA